MPTVSDLRTDLSTLSTLAAGDMRSLWRSVTNADEAREALEDLLPALIRTYGAAAATVAADWYDDLRDQLNIDRRFFAIVAEPDTRSASPLARWAVGPLYSSEPDWKSARSLVEGGLQKHIADAGRETVRMSSLEDSQSTGWQRSASDGCGFCQMLASRGDVYSSSSVDFGAHNNCRCIAVPAFRGRPKPVQSYTPSATATTPADRARTREWMREHGYL